VLPAITVLLVSITGPLVNVPGEGGMTPSSPVEKKVEVPPETVTWAEPSMTEKLPLEGLALSAADENAVGVMMPFCATEVRVSAEVKVKDPSVVDAGTEVGGITPSSPTMIRVDDPDMIVVVTPLIIVVTSAVVMGTGTAVEGCCITV
jgi:hypothetical protein